MTMMMMKVVSVLLASLSLAVPVLGATELTLDTFDGAVAGKNALVKFLAPW